MYLGTRGEIFRTWELLKWIDIDVFGTGCRFWNSLSKINPDYDTIIEWVKTSWTHNSLMGWNQNKKAWDRSSLHNWKKRFLLLCISHYNFFLQEYGRANESSMGHTVLPMYSSSIFLSIIFLLLSPALQYLKSRG